tara:strand:- start:3203 stop:4105 length:903 start_codon:yes stop_codon:yes gene_type:complete
LISRKELQLNSKVYLEKYTTLRIGGPAELFAEPSSIEKLKTIISWAKENKVSCKIIGAGSNLLISDLEIPGITICTRKLNGSEFDPSTGKINVLCGEFLPSIARKAANAGLKGLEWGIGIPGTVGGTVAMNAGAEGGCIAERIIAAEVIDIKGGKPFKISNKELDFSYRNSRLQKEDLIVLSASFQLEPGHNPKSLNQITNENLFKRKKSQPYHLATCGSVFRNPEPLKAGRLIENLGLKGLKLGGAEISKMHANFIVNTSNASASDVREIIKLIQKKVKMTHGFLLHTEVKQLGFERNV